jgi:hypothetical protein
MGKHGNLKQRLLIHREQKLFKYLTKFIIFYSIYFLDRSKKLKVCSKNIVSCNLIIVSSSKNLKRV